MIVVQIDAVRLKICSRIIWTKEYTINDTNSDNILQEKNV